MVQGSCMYVLLGLSINTDVNLALLPKEELSDKMKKQFLKKIQVSGKEDENCCKMVINLCYTSCQ